MRRMTIILLAAICAAFASPCLAERPALPTQNGHPVFVNFGAKQIATPTILLTPGVKTNIGSRLPAGTIGFSFDVYDGDILLGHEDNLATATSKWIGYKVASGTINAKWDQAGGGTINLWAMPNGSATCTVILSVAWGQWEQ
jgi:hypothetical protein